MNENLPSDNSGSGVHYASTQLAMISSHVGPLPSPEVLLRYEQAVPGIAERIIRMAEKEQQRRIDADQNSHDLEMQKQKNSVDNYKRGLIASLFFILLMFSFLFFCAYRGLNDVLIAGVSSQAVVAIACVIINFTSPKRVSISSLTKGFDSPQK